MLEWLARVWNARAGAKDDMEDTQEGMEKAVTGGLPAGLVPLVLEYLEYLHTNSLAWGQGRTSFTATFQGVESRVALLPLATSTCAGADRALPRLVPAGAPAASRGSGGWRGAGGGAGAGWPLGAPVEGWQGGLVLRPPCRWSVGRRVAWPRPCAAPPPLAPRGTAPSGPCSPSYSGTPTGTALN